MSSKALPISFPQQDKLTDENREAELDEMYERMVKRGMVCPVVTDKPVNRTNDPTRPVKRVPRY